MYMASANWNSDDVNLNIVKYPLIIANKIFDTLLKDCNKLRVWLKTEEG